MGEKKVTLVEKVSCAQGVQLRNTVVNMVDAKRHDLEIEMFQSGVIIYFKDGWPPKVIWMSNISWMDLLPDQEWAEEMRVKKAKAN